MITCSLKVKSLYFQQCGPCCFRKKLSHLLFHFCIDLLLDVIHSNYAIMLFVLCALSTFNCGAITKSRTIILHNYPTLPSMISSNKRRMVVAGQEWFRCASHQHQMIYKTSMPFAVFWHHGSPSLFIPCFWPRRTLVRCPPRQACFC